MPDEIFITIDKDAFLVLAGGGELLRTADNNQLVVVKFSPSVIQLWTDLRKGLAEIRDDLRASQRALVNKD